MKTFITLAACFGFGVVFCSPNSTIPKDFRLLASPPKQCSSPGLMCSDCQHLVSCISDGNGGFHQIPSQTCPSGQTCFDQGCTAERNPVCEALQYYQFVCKSSGMFPDPFDCQKYHFCLPNKEKPEVAQCDTGYGYHAGTTFCKTQLINNGCPQGLDEYPVPLCTFAGETGALAENPSLYFICIAYNTNKKDVLYPFLYACPHGGVYNNYECIS